ncbi:MAG: hypothetical protein L0Z07_10340 [Planctomycetes bacterium]|nr:hypothetical protein [Planctomycetota bacterium]
MNVRRMFSSILLDRVALTLALLVLFTGVAAACPNCRESLADPQQHAVATGFYYSILFMMSMPFAILGTFGSLAYLSIRRARTQHATTTESEQP